MEADMGVSEMSEKPASYQPALGGSSPALSPTV